ncbi:MAG: Rrf2 family nitric oxide-sensitive transcriptional repressor [Sulfitobacter sp.]|jgi:Rrf2 family transcriptional regulator, nitric oxide-sensitive transcriptional repressor
MLIKAMQLDKFSDYALRILMALAVHAPEKMSVARIARIYALSENHLSKVASALVHGGFLNSERGRSGGLALARPAEDISIGAVVRHLKADDPVVECFGQNSSCRILPACGLRQPLAQAQEAFFAVLDPYTLAHVARARGALAELLAP